MRIKISYCGICGSDLPKFLMKRDRPTILGHEFCGFNEKKEFGSIIPKLKNGFIGSSTNGGFQKFIDIPEENWFPTPKLINNQRLAALIEPMSNCVHCIGKLNFDNKTKIAIIGDGFIGNLLKSLIPNDVNILGKNDDTEENLYDIVIDCCGKPSSMNKAFKILKYKGLLMMLGIPYSFNFNNNFDYDNAMRKEIIIMNSWQSNFKEDWKIAYEILSSNTEKYEKLISKEFNLEQLVEAFNYKLTNHCLKILVNCGEIR